MSTPEPAAPMVAQKVRLTGVTVVAVLNGIMSILFLLGGLILMVAAPLIGAFMPVGMPSGAAAIAAIIGIVGIVVLIFGALGIVVTWGMWSGKSWAWWLTTIFSVIGALGGLFSMPAGIAALVIYGAIIYYFTRPHVKEFYGQKSVTVTMQV